MRGAFGKPQGVVARVDIGDFIMSVRVKDSNQAHAIEAFRRAKFKFPGRQYVSSVILATVDSECLQIVVSRKWGFTKFDRPVFETLRADGKLQPDGVGVKYLPDHGPLKDWAKRQAA